MKKVALAVAKAAKLSATVSCNSTSCIGLYQPSKPAQFNKTAKAVKK